ncbi:unnamed protein product [Protopolystoma xenopodis]|uniref:Uncharacterized protein n=1 Tax=Protopolystoma xenopodis TaxID=117903 RepID=A0A3S4ZLH3_9PLAT|nr:unnamed protein product [Protopolystoma xenopodis]
MAVMTDHSIYLALRFTPNCFFLSSPSICKRSRTQPDSGTIHDNVASPINGNSPSGLASFAPSAEEPIFSRLALDDNSHLAVAEPRTNFDLKSDAIFSSLSSVSNGHSSFDRKAEVSTCQVMPEGSQDALSSHCGQNHTNQYSRNSCSRPRSRLDKDQETLPDGLISLRLMTRPGASAAKEQRWGMCLSELEAYRNEDHRSANTNFKKKQERIVCNTTGKMHIACEPRFRVDSVHSGKSILYIIIFILCFFLISHCWSSIGYLC